MSSVVPTRAPFVWLLGKEARELVASRAWWVLLAAMGPLVGFAFISAVRTYGEASGLNGTAAGVGEAFSPLVGIWAPTFSACEVAAAFLLPFVAIRIVAGDWQSGAAKIEMQHPMPAFGRIAAKALVLAGAWVLASAPAAIAVTLWTSYGGSVYKPEVASVALGHLLNAGLTIALAAVTAAVSDHPSTAAILTLGVTVGTWILNLIAAVEGGVWERAAGYTPTAMVAAFQHGLVRLDVVLIASLLVITGLALAAAWTRTGVPTRRRANESIVLGTLTIVLALAFTFVRPTWDLSENRMNSFPAADEKALAGIRTPLRIEAHLAPEDSRRSDLERNVLAKLRRVMPRLEVQYVSSTSIGLFEQTREHYGEIWYELGGRREMIRATTAEGALETIYSLAAVKAPAGDDAAFRGHPLAAAPRGAATIFYGVWPAAVVAGAIVVRRRGV
jgi:hypothetical protein